MEDSEKIKILIEALGFYAERDNWVFSMSQQTRNRGEKVKRVFYREIHSNDTYGYDADGVSNNFGGMKARKALLSVGAFDCLKELN